MILFNRFDEPVMVVEPCHDFDGEDGTVEQGIAYEVTECLAVMALDRIEVIPRPAWWTTRRRASAPIPC